MLSEWENGMDGMLLTISIMVGCTKASDMMDRIELLLKDSAKVASKEEDNQALCREYARLWTDVWMAERELQEAKDRTVASGRALVEVKDALTLPIDVVNRARLFDERLEREDKLNQRHIIGYLNNHTRKMEKTWGQMQLLVGNIVPVEPVQQGT